MDYYLNDQQIEELVNFDHIEDLADLVEEEQQFSIEQYLNSNIDYWFMNFPTETVNVLPHMQELREAWKTQDFRFTREQQEQYDMLKEARKERVRWFYETGRVAAPGERLPSKAQQEEEDWYK